MRFPLSITLFQGRVKLFTIIVLVKILLMRSLVFPKTTDLKIVLLELASIVLIFGLLDQTKVRTNALFWIVDFLLSTYLMANVIYYSYFGQILNLAALRQTILIKDLGLSIFHLFSLSYFIFYFDFIWEFVQPILKKRVRNKSKISILLRPLGSWGKNTSIYRQKTGFITCFVALALSFLSIWLYPAKDNRMALTRDVGFLNAQGYELYHSLNKKKELPLPVSQFSQAAINQLKKVEPVSWPKYFGTAAGKNIILVQLESTENFLVGLKINNQEITPNLNRLSKESIYFPHFYSQVGQGTTSDAEFITNTSIYPRSKGGIATDYIGIDYPSLPRLLKEQGYTSVTFHPNVVTFWRRDNLYPCLGFDQYYDKKFYQDEDLLGPWGSSDEVLFRKALPVLLNYQKNNQKFYASLIALSNHHPFLLPDHKKHIQLPPRLEGTSVGNYLASVNYQDYALGQFIEALKASNLWNTTLFIVSGDHYGISKAMEAQQQDIFTLLLGREHDAIDSLNVPLLIRVPGLKPQVVDTLGAQVDILPTLANLLGITLDQQLIFGQDILNYNQNLLGFRFYHPDGTLMTSGLFHQAGSNEGRNLENRTIIKNKDFFLKEEQRIKSLMRISDSYLERLDRNKKSITFQIEK